MKTARIIFIVLFTSVVCSVSYAGNNSDSKYFQSPSIENGEVILITASGITGAR